MKRIALLLAVVTATLIAPTLPKLTAQTITRFDGTRLATKDAEAAAHAILARNNVTGAQIAIINRGKLAWVYTYGLQHKNPDVQMNVDTAMAVASITKSYFATYIMQLVQHGGFNLDQPLATQLPKPLDQYEGWQNMSLLVADPRWQRVTARMVLSHTSGLPSGSGSDPNGKPVLHFEPGTHWLYSNIAMNILALVIEQKFHRPLDQLMQESLFMPLNMFHTSMIDLQRLHPDISDRFDAKTGAVIDRGRPTVASAAGSVLTTATDLATLLCAILNNKILKSATVQTMLTPVIPIDAAHSTTYTGNLPNDTEVKTVGLAYGIGWGLLTTTPYGPAFFKEGHIDGANAYALCFTRNKDCMIIITNDDNGEHAYKNLFESLMADTVTPWKWEGYPTQ